MSVQTVRQHDTIVADCQLVATRLRETRVKLRDEGSTVYLSPAEFNTLTGQLANDIAALDGFLGELWDEMCWHNPQLLSS